MQIGTILNGYDNPFLQKWQHNFSGMFPHLGSVGDRKIKMIHKIPIDFDRSKWSIPVFIGIDFDFPSIACMIWIDNKKSIVFHR